MKTLITILCTYFSFSLFAQNDSLNIKSLHLGYFYSADFTKGNFNGGFGYNTGLNLLKPINNKWRLNFGIHLTKIVDVRKDLTFGNNLNPNTGTFDTTYTLRKKYHLIELPVSVNYFLSKSRRINTFLIAGVSPIYLLKTKTTYETNPSTGGEIEGDPNFKTYAYSTVGFGGVLGFGAEINITNRLKLNFQPEYRFYFIADNLKAMGLNSGITYRL